MDAMSKWIKVGYLPCLKVCPVCPAKYLLITQETE